MQEDMAFVAIEDIQCFNCKAYGHYHSDCPHPRRNTQTVGNTEETENMVNATPKTKKVKLTYKEAVMKQNGRVRKIAEEGNLEEI